MAKLMPRVAVDKFEQNANLSLAPMHPVLQHNYAHQRK
jgi:hypothetical protein